MKVTFKFEKSGVAEKTFDPAPEGMESLTEGQDIEIFFEKEGYAQDFHITCKSLDKFGDRTDIIYSLKFIPNTTKSKSFKEIAAEQVLAGMPKYDDNNFYP